MGNLCRAETEERKCKPNEHLFPDQVFACMNKNCIQSVMLCPACQKDSKKEKGKKLCRKCLIQEKFQDADDEDYDVETIVLTHNIVKVE